VFGLADSLGFALKVRFAQKSKWGRTVCPKNWRGVSEIEELAKIETRFHFNNSRRPFESRPLRDRSATDNVCSESAARESTGRSEEVFQFGVD